MPNLILKYFKKIKFVYIFFVSHNTTSCSASPPSRFNIALKSLRKKMFISEIETTSIVSEKRFKVQLKIILILSAA